MGVLRLIRGLCWKTISDQVTHNIQQALGRLGGHIGSEVCCRSPPSSILCNHYLSFQILNTELHNRNSIWRRKLKESKNCRTPQFVQAGLFGVLLPGRSPFVANRSCTRDSDRLDSSQKVIAINRRASIPSGGEKVALPSTRRDRRRHFPRINLEIGRRSFSFCWSNLYNGLPCELEYRYSK